MATLGKPSVKLTRSSRSIYPASTHSRHLSTHHRRGRASVSHGSGVSYVSMAESMFGSFDYGMDDDCDPSEPYEGDVSGYLHGNYNEDDLEGRSRYEQFSLQLETPEEMQDRMVYTMNKFNNAYERLAEFAVKWKMLQDALEAEPEIEKQFRSMMLELKLSGYNL